MYAVFAILCLSAEPDVCREFMLPVPDSGPAVCDTSAVDKARDWTAQNAGYRMSSAICRAVDAGSDMVITYDEIAPGVYVHEGQIGLPNPQTLGDLSNFGFVVGAQSVAVFDSGGSRATGEAALRGLRAITDLPISHVFLGHMHPDHIYGSTVFAEAGATVVGHPNIEAAMAARAENYADSLSRLMGPEGFSGSHIPAVDQVVTGTQSFDLGGRVLHVQSMPTAHTSSDLIMIDATSGTLFASDLVFLEHTPALDGSLRGWQAAMDALGDLKVERVVPGHGPVTAFPQALAPTVAYLNVLAESTKAHIDDGKSLSEAAPLIAQSERDKWKLFDEFNTRNATSAYAEIEWE